MHIQIESTDQVTNLDGVPCRLWMGVTAAGTPCLVFVHRLCAVDPREFDQLASEGELQEVPHPNFDPLPELMQ